MNKERYSVWVGGTEVTDHLVTKEVADTIALFWQNRGYDDVAIDEYKN